MLVFVISSVIHMVLPYHRSDFKAIPDEDQVMESLRKFSIPPGDYVIPCAGSPDEMRSGAFKEKTQKSADAFMTVTESGPPKMGGSLLLWFFYSLIVGTFAAYIASRALGHGAQYLDVFRFAGTTAFGDYSLALLQNSIWYKRNWAATLKSVLDGFMYALATAGVFGWLWPSV